MDLFRPILIQSKVGKRYPLIIVDEFSWFTCVLLHRSKRDAANEIIDFIKNTEVLLDKKARQIRSDHESKFKNFTLEYFYEEKGVSQKKFSS